MATQVMGEGNAKEGKGRDCKVNKVCLVNADKISQVLKAVSGQPRE